MKMESFVSIMESKMESFVIIVNGFQPLTIITKRFQQLTIITKCSILDVAAALDPPLINPFVPNAPFLYSLKTENFMDFRCF